MSPSTRAMSRCTPGPTGSARVALVGALVLASTAAAGQGLRLVPSLSVTEILTDNRDARANDRQADLISQISPGVSVSSRGGPLQGSLAYSANGLLYARDSSLNAIHHALNASGRYVLWDNRAGITATATAGRQAVSAFGTQSTSASLNAGNQSQVFSYSLAPYLQGQLLGNVSYRAQVAYSASHSDSEGVGEASSLSGTAGLSGRLGRLGWGLDASRVVSEQTNGLRTHNGRVVGSLNLSPDVAWQFSVRAGIEQDDLRSGQSERSATWGAGLSWLPGPRTSLRADVDRRFFGNSHSLSFTHRMARSIWSVSDSRSLREAGTAPRAEVSAYELFFAQFASVEPDPVQRDLLVRSFLAANGLDPGSTVIVGGFLTSAPSVQRRQQASMAYQGLRTTVTVSAFRSETRSVRLISDPDDDLADGRRVRQQGYSLSVAHRLTPHASLVIAASQQRTLDAGDRAGNDLQTITATWTARLGRQTSTSLGLRHTRSDSETNPYHESALIGSIRMQF
jgi:uncharacterized protein (PEP-CTERM system associated)